MKTAISLPDETFEAATRKAAEMGVSRSEFFARAAERYLRELEGESLTVQVNAALDRLSGDTDSAWAVEAGRRRLLAEDGW